MRSRERCECHQMLISLQQLQYKDTNAMYKTPKLNFYIQTNGLFPQVNVAQQNVWLNHASTAEVQAKPDLGEKSVVKLPQPYFSHAYVIFHPKADFCEKSHIRSAQPYFSDAYVIFHPKADFCGKIPHKMSTAIFFTCSTQLHSAHTDVANASVL